MLQKRLASALLACACLMLPAAARAGDDDLLTVAGQPKQQYYLIGADAAPEDKPAGLLLVMPGGGGGADFHPFVTSIQQSLPEGFLVAQLVAVPSDDGKVIWPTEKLKHRKQNFSTQRFIENVVKEVKAKHEVDAARVFALGWSSSGSAAYSSVLTPGSPVKGAVVAMSVFQPQVLPPLAGAKGRRIVVMHADGDKLIPVRAAEAAEQRLKAAGADVRLVRMSGGHGWEDDPLGRIASAVEWLARARHN